MEFYPDKCKVLKVTNKRKVIKCRYLLHNIILKRVSNSKYLVVTLTKRDNFYKETQQHVSQKQNDSVMNLSYDELWNTQAWYGIQLVIINLQNKLNQYKQKLHDRLQMTGIMTSALDKSQKNCSCKAFRNDGTQRG